MVKLLRIGLILLCVVSLVSGCASMTARQKGFVKGAAIGAAICGGTAAYVGHQNDSNPDKAALTGALACGLVGGTIGAILAKEDVVVPPEPVVEPMPEPVPEPEPEPAVVEEVKEEVVVPEVPEKIVLRGINFDFDKSDIKPEFVPVLDEAVGILKKHPDTKVIIEGHTDWTGTEKYNMGLSERRATSVCNYLVEKGISQNSLETVGYGEADPIADNHTQEGQSMNRRVVFKILD
ncbi:MAG: OmpA family protein [Thermodesulfobacteriota bacterium]|nr:OmpA family protein [Thermodesulfobacteriota bacterium]